MAGMSLCQFSECEMKTVCGRYDEKASEKQGYLITFENVCKQPDYLFICKREKDIVVKEGE